MRVERALVGLTFLASLATCGCGKLAYNLPPASRLMEPGPGVGGPGPGVIPPAGNPYGLYGGAVGRFGDGMGTMMGGGGPMGPGGHCNSNMPPAAARGGVMQANYQAPCEGPGGCPAGCPCEGQCDGSCPCGPGGCECSGGGSCNYGPGPGSHHGMHGMMGHDDYGCMRPGSMEVCADGAGGGGGGFVGMATSQIAFLGDDGVQVGWDVSGSGLFDATPLVIPGRQDFYQGAIYRLKLTKIPGRAGVQLYPTLEVAPVTPRTDAYLAHSPIPVQFTEEDFDQVVAGNFVTKVIYLPDPDFQELALAGVETLVSTRLDPGVDPIAEADRRGSILAILRMGNKDLELSEEAPAESSPSAPAVIPAGHKRVRRSPSSATQASYQEQPGVNGQPMDQFNGDLPVLNGGNAGQVYEGAPSHEGGQVYEGAPSHEGGQVYEGAPSHDGGQVYEGAPSYDGGQAFVGSPCGDGSMANMPMGMPTSGFAPTNVPPNMIAGAPQWGMPITGTPIGLPGPPHVPLGSPAGLQKHVMRNRTRVLLPPPVSKVELSVKQRPGMNYPRPVNRAWVDETQREPFRLLPEWMTNGFHRHQDPAVGPVPH